MIRNLCIYASGFPHFVNLKWKFEPGNGSEVAHLANMPSILICTDFSESSRNAVNYVLQMTKETNSPVPIQFILYHLFEMPSNYSGDGISLTTLNTEINIAEDNLNQEIDSILQRHPGVEISPLLSTAHDLRTGLERDILEIDPYLVIIGAGGNYDDLISWDKEIISIIRELPAPVLVIPKKVSYVPVKRIAFACNLKNANQFMPFPLIIRLINFTGSQLYVLFVKSDPTKKDHDEAENLVKEKLQTLHPVYHSAEEKNIVAAVSNYIKENSINVLLVTPREHGVWENIMYKNHARELVRLNFIPLLALRQHNR